ncbi:MAG: acetate/propionate family kinase [Polyangiaceae bacterium]|nr:acetate/propionate family kinase [Polyangiaceae bacterium]
MNVLTFSVSHRVLAYAAWYGTEARPAWSGSIDLERGPLSVSETIDRALGVVRSTWELSFPEDPPSAVALRVVFGGEHLSTPALATPRTLAELEALVPRAPLHLPPTIAAARAIPAYFEGSPVLLAVETAFFRGLPERERSYGLDPELNESGVLSRFGYHGLFHQAACVEISRTLRASAGIGRPRLLSLCLEPRPELVGVDNGRPLTVTSGATPLEGLPGDTSAGESDPAIVLTLSERAHLGPEEINTLLTRESGLSGLVDHPTTLERVMRDNDPASLFAREVLEHRLLLAAGAAVAALGGLDGIVLSGRYAEAAAELGLSLVRRLSRLPGVGHPLEHVAFTQSLGRLVADQALAGSKWTSDASELSVA